MSDRQAEHLSVVRAGTQHPAVEGRASLARFGEDSRSGDRICDLIHGASEVLRYLSRTPAVLASEYLDASLETALTALARTNGLLCESAKPDPHTFDPLDLLEQMRPNLERRLQPAGSFTIDVCRHVPHLCCNAIGFEATILSLLLYGRKELRAVSDVRLNAVGQRNWDHRIGILFEATLSSPGSSDISDGGSVTGAHSRRDEIGLATARLFVQSVNGRVALDRPVDGTLKIRLWLPCPPLTPKQAYASLP